MDTELMDGIKLWISARQLEAIRCDRRESYRAYALLQEDIAYAETRNTYPWDVIKMAFADMQKEKEKD